MVKKIIEIIAAAVAIIGFFGGFALWAGSNITGNAVGAKPTDWIGGILIIIGIIGTFFLASVKKKSPVKARTRKTKKVSRKKKL